MLPVGFWLMAQRHEAILAAYESAEGRLRGMSFTEFLQAISNWDVLPVKVDGEIVGAVLMNGPEIHACIKPKGFKKWLTKSVLRKTVYRLVKEHGKAVTRVEEGNVLGEHFVSRLGFKKEGQEWVLKRQL